MMDLLKQYSIKLSAFAIRQLFRYTGPNDAELAVPVESNKNKRPAEAGATGGNTVKDYLVGQFISTYRQSNFRVDFSFLSIERPSRNTIILCGQ
jgi:hypothetical protein